jgi:hypothetical protein
LRNCVWQLFANGKIHGPKCTEITNSLNAFGRAGSPLPAALDGKRARSDAPYPKPY